MAEIYRKHSPSIYGYLSKKASNEDTAEDILHEVFRQVMEGKCRYDGASSPQSYLIGVARTLLKKELSKAKAAGSVVLPGNIDYIFTDNEIQSPIEKLQAIEFRQDLKTAITRLLAASKSAIKSVYLAEKSSSEAAKESGCSYNTLRKRIQYALGALKKIKSLRL